jgi:2-C-methyl-D-erythritol 4-phosphate cytidylyltransferase/2-C-methyl-D-erythritol 2,4-cyclodiphosphate synthase
VAGIIVAAGRGDRAGGNLPKQYRALFGRSLIAWSITAMSEAGIAPIVVAIAQEHEPLFRAATRDSPSVQTVVGGATRTQSVRAALAAIDEADVILVHDAARPALSSDLISSLVRAIDGGAGGSAPALAIADALWRVDPELAVVEGVPRADLMRVQTPQAFRASVLRAAYAALPAQGALDDDIAVVRAHGARVVLVPGDPRLMKVTYPEDIALLEEMLSAGRTTCVGSGFDAHRFGPGDHVMLCGVQIPHDKGLIGHSDADAGWHALVDAILGALGDGDIGAHFPPSDPQWKGAPSERFLQHAATLAEKSAARIIHVDITLICERPKIGPHRETMRARTAEVLGLPLACVSVKATTTERMGFAGREEGLVAHATATVERPRQTAHPPGRLPPLD